MTQLSLTVTNAELVRMGLQNLAAEVPKIGQGQIWNSAQAIVKRMKQYPPERINQRYRRTGTLGYGWGVLKKNNGYTVQNDTPYTKYVVGNAYGLEQAWMHVSTDQGKRWNVLRDVVEEEVNLLPKAINEEIDMVARRSGL